MKPRTKILSFALAFLFLCSPVLGQRAGAGADQNTDLTSLNIEDLMNVKVTSVSKTEEKLSRTASAVFVIGSEDIRHSGALNIPDLLRMVPGVEVAQISANAWAIAVRGFNGRLSNKLLVLLDGRAVYTPTLGDVFWDVLDVPLEDIERIEVIRGPGGSVWGANAVNGVINIITKGADKTHGGLVVAGGGNTAQGFGTVQYGGTLAKTTDYRIYSNYLNEKYLPNGAGQNGGDGWHLLQGGFRTDTTLSTKDTLMVQGSIYTGEENVPDTFLTSVASAIPQFMDARVPLSGGYVQSVWNHTFSERSGASLEVSYDSYRRNDALREARRIFNVGLQHHILWGDRPTILWGIGAQYSSATSTGNLIVSLVPAAANYYLLSSFIQDEITLIPERLYLTVGTKVERNYYTGWAAMPGARVAWQVTPRHMLWAAYSRPIQTPTELEIGFRSTHAQPTQPGGLPALLKISGNPNFQNENMSAYEMGYRATVSEKLSIDIAAYYDDYKNQQTYESGEPSVSFSPPPFHVVIPIVFGNLMHGEGHGLEISGKWKVLNRWSLSPGYAFGGIHMHTAPTSKDSVLVPILQGSSPVHSAQLRSRVELPHGLAWDATAYFVDRLAFGNVPSYTRLDTQLTWNWAERGSLSLVGQNLQQDHHFEFLDYTESTIATQAKRSAYLKFSWRF